MSILKVLAVATAFVIVISCCGGLYAQADPPGPGQAMIPGASSGALMKMTISQKCTAQDKKKSRRRT